GRRPPRRAAGVGRGLGDVRGPAAGGGHRQGGDQPAALPVAARAAEGEEEGAAADRAGAARRRPAEGAAPRSAGRGRAGRDPRRGRRRGAARRGASRRAGGPRMILALVEPQLDEVSLEALTFARRLGEPLHAVVVGDTDTATLGAYGVSVIHVVRHDRLDEYAPEAWAQGVVELAASLAPEAVVAPGSA